MISSCCKKIMNIFNIIIYPIKFFKKHNDIQEDTEINTNSDNEENTPAKILSSEEINEMINNQIKYNKEQANTNEYKIIKQKNTEDVPKTGELLNLEEIKNEINQIEFEEEEQKKKKKKEIYEDNGMSNEYNDEEEKNAEEHIDDNNEEEEDENANINIEELRKDVLENNDD